jgi:hypothetical protein
MAPVARRAVAAAVAAAVLVVVAAIIAPHGGLRGPSQEASSTASPGSSPASPTGTVAPSAGATTLAPGVRLSADVVVYGATPSGILAAVSAAREGVSVVLISPDATVGGMMTSGLGHADILRKDLLGGLTLDVFERIGRVYAPAAGSPTPGWNYEPHVAAAVFDSMLREAGVRVYLGMHLDRTRPPDMTGHRILALHMTDGTIVRGTVFVDATYEGDLLAAAGVPFRLGRESSAQFGESLAGVRVSAAGPDTQVNGLDASGQPLPGSATATIVPGAADGLVQAATFRLCVTTDPANRVPFAKPAGYDPGSYALVGRALQTWGRRTGTPLRLDSILSFAPLPHGKADLNSMGLYSTDLLGGGIEAWAAASDATRLAIWQQHRAWVSGLLWYLETSSTVPAHIGISLRRWGLCADEFAATGHWPPELYLREARRMAGDVVLTQRDLQTDVTKPDPIALGTYRLDSHFVRRILGADGLVRGEGQFGAATRPYQIPYDVLVPPLGSVDNLLVSVDVSVSHVAWASIRTEPTFMEMGEAAGAAAALSVREGRIVRGVDYPALRSILLDRGGILAAP